MWHLNRRSCLQIRKIFTRSPLSHLFLCPSDTMTSASWTTHSLSYDYILWKWQGTASFKGLNIQYYFLDEFSLLLLPVVLVKPIHGTKLLMLLHRSQRSFSFYTFLHCFPPKFLLLFCSVEEMWLINITVASSSWMGLADPVWENSECLIPLTMAIIA